MNRTDQTFWEQLATIDSGTADGVIGADWFPATGTLGGYPIGGLIFRFKDRSNYWVACHGCLAYGALGLWKVVDGNPEKIEMGPSENPAGAAHRLEVRLAGPIIEVSWDGVRQIRAVDSFEMSATRHGLLWSPAWDSLSQFDNFSVLAPAVQR